MTKEKKIKKTNSRGGALAAIAVAGVTLAILAGITTVILINNGKTKSEEKAKIEIESGTGTETKYNNSNKGNYDQETGWDLNKVKKAKIDGQNIPVPHGYTLSKAEKENSIATGLVLYEEEVGVSNKNVETARETRNQFVWVPVPDITEMVKLQEGSDKNYMGMLYTFDKTTATYQQNWKPGTIYRREPNGVTYYDTARYLQEAGVKEIDGIKDINSLLQEEFNNMVESVKLYKGFYIGRYETSGLSNSDTTVKPKVKKVAYKGLNNASWYRMYVESKNIKANDNVISSMIWGCQWDATLRWFQTSTDSVVKNFPTNSFAFGNFWDNSIYYKLFASGESRKTTAEEAEIIPTGSAETTKINNIYDMAGNLWESTMEAYDTYERVCRRWRLCNQRKSWRRG